MASSVMKVTIGGAFGLYVLYSLLPSIMSFKESAVAAASGQNAALIGLTVVIFLLVVVGAMAKEGDLI